MTKEETIARLKEILKESIENKEHYDNEDANWVVEIRADERRKFAERLLHHSMLCGFSSEDEIIKAIDKQMPKKPKRIEYVDGGAEEDCPNCGKRICMVFRNGDTFRWQMPYCCDCGQKLDWEEHTNDKAELES